MSIIKMKKVAVIGLDTVKEKLISELMEAGVMQITDQGQRLTEEETWKDLGVKDGDDNKVTLWTRRSIRYPWPWRHWRSTVQQKVRCSRREEL